jgi:hypothetical protein
MPADREPADDRPASVRRRPAPARYRSHPRDPGKPAGSPNMTPMSQGARRSSGSTTSSSCPGVAIQYVVGCPLSRAGLTSGLAWVALQTRYADLSLSPTTCRRYRGVRLGRYRRPVSVRTQAAYGWTAWEHTVISLETKTGRHPRRVHSRPVRRCRSLGTVPWRSDVQVVPLHTGHEAGEPAGFQGQVSAAWVLGVSDADGRGELCHFYALVA